MRANVPLNEEAIEAHVANGVDAPVTDAPITALFRSTEAAEHMVRELRQLENAGQLIVTARSGEALREQVPLASPAITAALSINGQRFVDPGRFVHALGQAVVERGATMRTLEVRSVFSSGSGTHGGSAVSRSTADAAVIHRRMAVPAGGRAGAGAGAGRSRLLVHRAGGPPDPRAHLSARRAGGVHALPGRIGVSGTIEFGDPYEPAVPPGGAIVASQPTIGGVRWAERSDIWAGPRPDTPNGHALIGEMSRGVYVAGGHGMWAAAHGPVTRRLLAEYITTGKQPEALREFDRSPNRPLDLATPRSKPPMNYTTGTGARVVRGGASATGPPRRQPLPQRKDTPQ